MSNRIFQQQVYDYLHTTRQLPYGVIRKVKSYFDRVNFFKRDDPYRVRWYKHKRFKDRRSND